jgi:hypothetical protein
MRSLAHYIVLSRKLCFVYERPCELAHFVLLAIHALDPSGLLIYVNPGSRSKALELLNAVRAGPEIKLEHTGGSSRGQNPASAFSGWHYVD